MPIGTHAAVRKLENGGFETEQAEALVEVINGVAGEQATKEDLKVVREDIKVLREDFKDQFATKADFAKLETKIETVSNRMLFALIAVAGLLFAALRLWP